MRGVEAQGESRLMIDVKVTPLTTQHVYVIEARHLSAQRAWLDVVPHTYIGDLRGMV